MPRSLLTEAQVIQAWKTGKRSIQVESNTIITPAARDAAKARGIEIILGPQGGSQTAPPAASAASSIATGTRTLAIAADHGGFELKQALVPFLKSLGYQVQDLGTNSPDPVDYPDIAEAVAEKVANGSVQWGIIIDGAGIGSAMVANKVPGVRAACCNDLFSAVNSREHNGANVLTLGGRMIGEALAKKIVETWLQTSFGGGRHQRRVEKIMAVEAKYRHSG